MRGKPGDRQESYITRGYRAILRPGHPRPIDRLGHYVLEHVLVAEKALGRYLEAKHPVHHFNEIRADNRNENLVICEDNGYHRTLHARQRIVAAGGDPNTQKICMRCHELKLRTLFHHTSDRGDGLSPNCILCRKELDAEKHRRQYVRKERASLSAFCGNGHEYTDANTYIKPDGNRQCRSCCNERARRNRSTKGGQALMAGRSEG